MITIRLKKTGTKSRKQWRVVVVDNRAPRNGRLMEEIGFYNPLREPPAFQMDRERYRAWIGKGAQPSERVRTLVKEAENSGDAR